MKYPEIKVTLVGMIHPGRMLRANTWLGRDEELGTPQPDGTIPIFLSTLEEVEVKGAELRKPNSLEVSRV